MKRMILLLLVLALTLTVCGCGNHNNEYLPEAEDFLSVNTITGLLNRYQSLACFEKLVNTADGEDKTRSWQFYETSDGGVSQHLDGDAVQLYYNRFLFTSPDDGRTVHHAVYLNKGREYEGVYFDRENLFGQEDGAEIARLDQQTETFRFTSTLVLNESNIEPYRLWDVAVGDTVVGTYTVAKDDLRILKSELHLKRGEEETLLSVSAWTYAKPLQLHAIWENYKNSEDRKLITIFYEDGEERRYFFPTGTVPTLYTEEGHQLFMDKEATVPYVAEPITEPITIYYK
ncbi:MAG: hypothetical protein J6D04_05340 [Clostridia bacterium]|nr:hypothetical protein [Clostridia bacterium]